MIRAKSIVFGLGGVLCFVVPLFLCPCDKVLAQTWTMPVDGKVFGGGDKLSGAIITLYRGGQQIQQVVTTSNGRFSFELPPNADYLISVTKPGYITKKFKINTANVPPERAEVGGFNPFEPDVTLFEMPTAPEISKRVEAILSQPLAIYQYIPAETNFNYDEKYTQAIQDKLAELAQLQKQVEKEVEEKAKNAAVEAQKQMETDKKYNAAIAKADAAFTSKDYTTSKNFYNEATVVKPAEQYPKTRLAEINKILADAGKQAEIDAKYQAAIKSGDAAFNKKDYVTAKAGYTEAAGVKPAEAYPKQKIAEIDKLLADAEKQKELDTKYQAAITKGDGAFASKDYASAKTAYTEATGLKPAEAYPKQKISEIDKLMADAGKQKELDAKYQAAITKGDGAFGTKDYATAKSAYTEALGIKPGEAYPKQKLSEIDKLLADAGKQKELDAKYQAAITKGDGSFTSKDYAAAKSAFTDASGLKPNEAYPKTKIAEIDKLLAEMSKAGELEKQYKDLIAKADNAFGKKDYAAAKSSYSDASALKSTEQYPKTKIAEIDKLLADAGKQKELDAKYQAAITKGDGAFASKDYAGAKAAFTEASGLKPAEAYPKQKMSEIDKLMADSGKQKELDAKYQAAITKGDGAFGTKDYATAKSAYTEASGIKPGEAYPKQKLAEIDKLLADGNKQKELDAKYQAAITKGDGAFTSRDYAGAKSAFTDASGLKPNEAYPKTKIAEIDKLLAEMSKAGELEKQYKDLIAKADNAFAKKDYVAARSSYSDASSLKASEQYPKTKITEIDKLLTDLAAQKSASERDQQYKTALAKADKLFASKDYANSKSAYNEALGVKPNEAYPKTKIAEIDKLMGDAANIAAQKEIDAKYQAAISKADGAFTAKDYPGARTAYTEASGIKPAEAYPKTKLAEIDKLMADAENAAAKKEADARYNATILKADNSFKAKDYSTAKPQYQEASRIKPLEPYPKNQIAEIERIEKSMADAQAQKENNLAYNQAIATADKAFAKKDYASAKASYEEAQSYKPAEKYPKDKLAQINNILNKPLQTVTQNIKKDPNKQTTPVVSEDEKKKIYQSELRSKYPAGVTEEEYSDNGKTVLRRIVIRDDYAGVFIKVTHNWGGVYFFKDNIPITEVVFENESR